MSILYKTTRFADTFTGDKETTVIMGYTGHQSIRRISGNQIQPIQRRSIQKPQHSTGRNGSRTERRKHTQSGRLRQFLSKRKFL